MSPRGRSLKRAVAARYSHFAVPGKDGSEAIRDLLGNSGARIHTLPNIVDESRFRAETDLPEQERRATRQQLGVVDERKIALVPARLSPEKGLLPMLGVLRTVAHPGWRVVILGDGPLRATIEERITELGLSSSVSIAQPVDYEDMPHCYAAASLFVLPSIWDHNPLTVIEAMWSGLPLLVSKRVGNYPEAMGDPPPNGWSFDPANGPEMTAAFKQAFTCPKTDLTSLGRVSRERALRFWSSERSVCDFLGSIEREAYEH